MRNKKDRRCVTEKNLEISEGHLLYRRNIAKTSNYAYEQFFAPSVDQKKNN